MNNTESRPVWMDDELVKEIPTQKLIFLAEMFQEGHGKNQKEMLAFLIPMMKKAKRENLTFTPAEMNAAITAIKKHSTQEELTKINRLLDKAQQNTSGGK